MQALVLGGGGARGSYEMGVWKALIDMDISIDIVVGTSIGAVNGALIAQGDYRLAEELWRTFDIGKMLGVDDYKGKDVKEKFWASLQRYTKETVAEGAVGVDATEFKLALQKYIDEEKVRASRTKFGLMTVELQNLAPIGRFAEEMPAGQIVDHIMASAAIVPALRPYEIDGKKYIDGAYYDNIPLELAKSKGATEFIVVDLHSFGRVRKEVFAAVAKENMKYIRPYWDLGFGLVLDEDLVSRNMALGYFDTMKAFQAFEGNAYTFIKDTLALNIENMRKDTELANRMGLYFSRKRTIFDDKLIQAKWKLILEERTKKGSRKINDILSSIEIAAELLKIDPTKVYTIESMNQKIAEKLAQIELPEMDVQKSRSPRTLVKNAANEIEALSDEQKRLKYFAIEIKKSLKGNEDILTQQIMASLYTKTFIGGLYIAMQNLV